MIVTPSEIFADPTQTDATAEISIEIIYVGSGGGNSNYLYDGPALLINTSVGLVTKLEDAPHVDDHILDESGHGKFTAGSGSFVPLDNCWVTSSHSLTCSVFVTSLSQQGKYYVVSNGYVVQPSPNCSSDLSSSFTFIRSNSAANQASDAVGTTIAGGASLVTLLSAADIQLYAMLLSSPCSSRNDVARVSVLRYFVSPFTSLGDTWVIVGGAAIIILAASCN